MERKAGSETEKGLKEIFPAHYRAKKDSGTMVRFSEEELDEFRTIILQKIEEAESELLKAKGLPGSGELPSESLQKEIMDIQSFKQRLILKELNQALKRIENKTFGICSITGKLIDKSRLKRVPYLTSNFDDIKDLPY
jgi:RNA polymerase-binding transcription factor DksA